MEEIIGSSAAKYFCKPYKDDKYNYINNVYRPNHGLCHSIRQGFLSKDLIDHLYHSTIDNDIVKWIKKKVDTDKKFKTNIFFVSCFQRSGRQSEVSSLDNLELYKQYEEQDICYFKEEAKNYFTAIELEIYSEAIRWSTIQQSKINSLYLSDVEYIRRIIHTAHLLDLRRICTFNIKRIIGSSVSELFGKHTINNNYIVYDKYYKELHIILCMWNQSGKYLYVTGDRDIVFNKNYYSPVFFDISNDPSKIILKLSIYN